MNSILKKYLDGDSFYKEALSIVRANTDSKIYLAGGYIFRLLANGSNAEAKDIDFVIHKLKSDLTLFAGWELAKNTFGQPRFIKGHRKIDPIMLTKHVHIARKDIEPTIENYLLSVPLNIQSIVYDVDEEKLTGDIGLKAIAERKIRLNNYEHAKYSCENFHKIPVNELITRMADSLGFDFELPQTTSQQT